MHHTSIVCEPRFIDRVLRLKNHRIGRIKIFCKNRALSIKGGRVKHCFPLIMYGFCSSKTLYWASLPFGTSIFFDSFWYIWDCYYFKSNLSLVLLIKVLLIKKAWRNKFATWVYFWVYLGYFIMVVLLKKPCQKRRFWKKDKKGGWPYKGVA